MFDQFPEPEWDDEPTEIEVRVLICAIKKEIINKYKLKTINGIDVVLPKTFKLCHRQEDLNQNTFCNAARKCLEVTVFTGKTCLPTRYHHLFDELLVDWLPLIN